MVMNSLRFYGKDDLQNQPSGFERRRPLAEPEGKHLDLFPHNDYGIFQSDDCDSDYDLDAFGLVDVDPTLTESEWLRSQGIDPDLEEKANPSKDSVAVLSLAEVSYNRDIGSVNKAERERHIRSANALWGENAMVKRPPSGYRDSSKISGKKPSRGKGKGNKLMHPKPSRMPFKQQSKTFNSKSFNPSSPQTFTPYHVPKEEPKLNSLRPTARTFIPMTVSIDGMNPNAPAFIPGVGFKS